MWLPQTTLCCSERKSRPLPSLHWTAFESSLDRKFGGGGGGGGGRRRLNGLEIMGYGSEVPSFIPVMHSCVVSGNRIHLVVLGFFVCFFVCLFVLKFAQKERRKPQNTKRKTKEQHE